MRTIGVIVLLFGLIALCWATVELTDDNFSQVVGKQDEWLIDL